MRFRGAAIGIGTAVIFTLALLLLLPYSPIDQVTPGLDLKNLERDQQGELNPVDIAFIQFTGGAAVDYPTFGEFAAANGIEFEYWPVRNFGYNPAYVDCGPSGVNCLHGQNQPIVIVDHIAEGSCEGMKSWFDNPVAFASAHFGVCRDGKIIQFLELEDAAWTQGLVLDPGQYISIYGGINPNLRSISIEHEGKCSDNKRIEDFPRQAASSRLLHGWLRDTVGIPLVRATVLEHGDIDNVNKSQDWNCLVGSQDAWVAGLAPAPATDLDAILERLDAIEARLTVLEGATPAPPPPTPGATPAPAPQECLYTVISSDWDGLSGIAGRQLGDTNRWPEIASLNGMVSPYVLSVGQMLEIPCG
jgi:hypothetical protein